jgi:hypothetical protein
MLTDRAQMGPLIQVRSVADTADQAEKTEDAVLQEISVKLSELQNEAGVPLAEQITANVVTSSRIAIAQSGNQRHAQAAALLIGYLLGGVIWRRAVRIRRWIDRRRQVRNRRSVPVRPIQASA